jgi:hypothetical protein
MEENLLRMIVPGIGLISGLIATYVSLQNRVLLAEVRKELAEMENRLYLRFNGMFVRVQECRLREDHVQDKLEELAAVVQAGTRRG